MSVALRRDDSETVVEKIVRLAAEHEMRVSDPERDGPNYVVLGEGAHSRLCLETGINANCRLRTFRGMKVVMAAPGMATDKEPHAEMVLVGRLEA